MKFEKTWTRHFQDVWEERAANPDLPQWLRVFSLACGLHKANGHAPLPPRALAIALARPDPLTGEMIPDPNPGRAVRTAVRSGWLSPLSTVRCLVVPHYAVAGGMGNSNAVCPVHGATGPR